jgi:L-2-amino-thiazoline-4-carboxylic acid hydrolase
MRVEDLRNYGKGLMDCIPDTGMTEREGKIRMRMQQELERELGRTGATELMSRMKEEAEHMKARDLSSLKKRGLHDRRFIESVIKRIALMKALADMIGMEKASALQCRLVENTIWELMSPMWPSMDDYRACGNFFEAFKKYGTAAMVANARAGLHDVEMVEDSPTALAFNVKYCVWHEAAKLFGDPYLCYPSTCYGDEVTIPRVLSQIGGRFKRAGTLAQGAPVCDFRYEFPAPDDHQR